MLSQGWGEGGWGEGPFGGGDRSDNQPRIPFIVGIKVYLDDWPLNNTLTQIKNLNTQDSETKYTNFGGGVLYELSNFETRYSDGDVIEIKVCMDDSRCIEESRNYTLRTNQGGLIIDFKLITREEPDLIVSNSEGEAQTPIEIIPKNDTSIIISVDNSTHIIETIYIDNSTHITEYVDNSSKSVTNIINKNYFFPITISLVFSIGILISFFKWDLIINLFRKKK